MSFFAIVSYTVIVAVLGYMLGRSDGKDEGYLDGRAEMYQEVAESKGTIYKEKR